MQFLVGGLASICNIAIHSLVMLLVIRVAQAVASGYTRSRPPLLVAVMAATVLVLMVAHAVEVLVWAFTYFLVGAVPPATTSSISHT